MILAYTLLMNDLNCIFCKIVKGEIPSEKIYEDENLLAFMDIFPINKGHVLIITKDHYQWMQDVPDELISKSFIKTKELITAIKNGVGADYVQISVVGKDVPHFHIHLIPRFNDDGFSNWETKKYEEGEIKEFADKIRG